MIKSFGMSDIRYIHIHIETININANFLFYGLIIPGLDYTTAGVSTQNLDGEEVKNEHDSTDFRVSRVPEEG